MNRRLTFLGLLAALAFFVLAWLTFETKEITNHESHATVVPIPGTEIPKMFLKPGVAIAEIDGKGPSEILSLLDPEFAQESLKSMLSLEPRILAISPDHPEPILLQRVDDESIVYAVVDSNP